MPKTVQKDAFYQIYIDIGFGSKAKKKFVSLQVSTKGMRIIDKKGIETVVSELRARGEKI